MARSYQVSCGPASRCTLADLITMGGGHNVIILNAHATEPLYVGGDENELSSGGGSTLSTSTGIRVAAGKALTATINGSERLFAISGTSTVTITAHVFRTSFKFGSTGLA